MTTSVSLSATVLLDKYAGLHRQVEEARRERDDTWKQVEELRLSHEELDRSRIQLVKDTQTAVDERHEWQDRYDQSLLQASQTERGLQQAHEAHAQAQHRHRSLLEAIRDHPRVFMEECAQFRLSTKRLRLATVHPPDSQAFLLAYCRARQETTSSHQEDLRQLELLLLEEAAHRQESEETCFRETNKNEAGNDHQRRLQDALNRAKETLIERKHAKEKLEQAQRQLEDAQANSQRRQQQRHRLELQLQRLLQECTELDGQVATLQLQTSDCNDVIRQYSTESRQGDGMNEDSNNAGNPEEATTTQRPSPALGASSVANTQDRAPRPTTARNTKRNPYSKSVNGSGSSSRGRTPNATAAASAATARMLTTRSKRSTALERQYPHLAGRIRVDRQFASALEILGDDDEESGEEAHPHSLEEELHTQNVGPTTMVTPPNEKTSTSYSAALLSQHSDDDDDDDLLSYVAFDNKTTPKK